MVALRQVGVRLEVVDRRAQGAVSMVTVLLGETARVRMAGDGTVRRALPGPRGLATSRRASAVVVPNVPNVRS